MSLEYPIAYWDGPPPSHSISSLAVCRNPSDPSGPIHLLTGSTTGQLVHWVNETETQKTKQSNRINVPTHSSSRSSPSSSFASSSPFFSSSSSLSASSLPSLQPGYQPR